MQQDDEGTVAGLDDVEAARVGDDVAVGPGALGADDVERIGQHGARR